MRGKPIEAITLDDIEQLIKDGAVEDRRLEFKIDISVSAEEQKHHRKNNLEGIIFDRSWTKGQRLPDFGRDALAEEIVAFANADGGTLILGLDETDEAPPRAKGLNPLPDIAGLERRLQDALIDCVEPRLPYFAVRGILTDVGGSGVVVIEVGASALGPHWVRRSRKPTMRRGDRSVPLSMTEVHEMVLRNTRGREAVIRRSETERAKFPEAFNHFLRNTRPDNFIGSGEAMTYAWLNGSNLAALGAQIVLTPHYDLAMPRLERMDGLMPASNAIRIEQPEGERETLWIDTYTYAPNYTAKILGGVRARQEGGFEKSVTIMRTGEVIVSFMQVREVQSCTCSADLIVCAAGFAAGVFDRLRRVSNNPAAPADIAIDIMCRGMVGVGNYSGVGFRSSYGRLDEHVRFPIYTIGPTEDITTMLRDVAGDLMNAAGLHSGMVPPVVWHDPF